MDRQITFADIEDALFLRQTPMRMHGVNRGAAAA